MAKKAVERGLSSRPWVKTSLAPGSMVVTEYLQEAGLLEPLEQLGFGLVGYGCTTCIGNSGPLPEEVARAIKEHDLVVASVLSGNRNFEGRVQPLVRANYLASPPLVVAYALAGRMTVDLTTEPLGEDRDGQPVYLRDLWPTSRDVQEAMAGAVQTRQFREKYAAVFEGDERWRGLDAPRGAAVRLGRRIDLCPHPAVLRAPVPRTRPAVGHQRRASPGAAGRQRHHGPHLAGRCDPGRRPGRSLSDRARHRTQGLQFVR